MVELRLQAARGSFCLDIACRFTAPWTVVFGPSGAGKSTLLRLIAGLERPDSGRIAIHGRYVMDTDIGLNLTPGPFLGQRGVGLVAQQSALFPHLSVAANVAYGLAALGREVRKRRGAAMLEVAGAAHLAERWPRDLSGGEAQRVSLARALAPMPRLLLLDEPLSALDAEARDQVLARLQAWLKEEKIQTILVTHDAADALATEAEVALLQEGKLASLGPANEVLARERKRLLARLGAETQGTEISEQTP
jgi:ABC-type sulfate/molybdate transport systems ATPase subunit